ncbi:MAG: B12-binding domain-containing radical SAM protein [Spirochaetales bacterium]
MPKNKFLFVYPKVPETYWSFKHTLSLINKKALMLPLGLATVAGLVDKAYSVTGVDVNVTPLKDSHIEEADLVLVSAMLIQKQSFLEIVHRCKEKGKPVAVGGPYPTESLEELQSLPSSYRPDYFILNEGEVTFPQFLKDWEQGKPREIYQSSEKPSLDRCPLPRFDLFNLPAYNVLPLQFSRGCPFDCEFCDIVHLFGRVPRTKPPEQFLTELNTALQLGFRGNVFVVDDNFIGNRTKVKELLRAIIQWQKEHKYPVGFSTEASVDLAKDEELLELMVQARFTMVFIGLETPILSSLQEAGKVQNLKNSVIESVRKIQLRGIEVTGGFILGFDSDPEDIAQHQIHFIEELAIPTAMVGLLTALPGTKLYHRLVQEGRIISNASGNNTHTFAVNFKPKLSVSLLLENYRKVISSIYHPKAYFNRCIEFLNRLPKIKASSSSILQEKRVNWGNLKVLFRSLLRQALSWYGLRYLYYLFRALKAHPDKIVPIISFAVQGHHLLQISRKLLRSPTPSGGIYRTG